MSGAAVLGAWSKSKRRLVAMLATGFLLFTQLAMASQACMLAPRQAAAMEGCDGMAMDKAICQVHCATADQAGASPDQPFVSVPPSSAAATGFPNPANAVPAMHVASLPVAGPPLRVLYCSYLT